MVIDVAMMVAPSLALFFLAMALATWCFARRNG
jgi:hypothetical protein